VDLYDRVVQRKRRRRERLEAALSSLVSQLKDLGAVKVILFGSAARGEVDVDSDLDLLVLMPGTKSGREWRNLVYEKTSRDVAADMLVYTVDEWEREKPVSTILQTIAREGRVVGGGPAMARPGPGRVRGR